MSLTNYDDLKAEISSNLARSDVTTSSEVLDTFIDLAEAKINKMLRNIRMQTELTLVTTGDDYIDLPSDFMEVYSFGYSSVPKELEFIPRSFFKKVDETSGKPDKYTLSWNKVDQLHQVKFAGTPSTSLDLDMVYYARIPALTTGNPTNWLITDYPELYLNACLYYGFKRYRSPLAADYKALFEADISELNAENERIQTGGGGTRIRISGATP